MILVDTPIWIDHLASPRADLTERLRAGVVRMHPFVLGEIMLGNLSDPVSVLGALRFIRKVTIASPHETLDVIRRHDLAGSGVGYVDAHLVASVLLTPPCRLWTRDRRLHAVAVRVGVAADVS